MMDSSLHIAATDKDAVLQIWKNLNKPENNNIKSGGSYSLGSKNAHWFAWMPANYDETVESCEEVLDLLGFTYNSNEFGIDITGYSSKQGDEAIFYQSAKKYITGAAVWIGEDDEEYTWG